MASVFKWRLTDTLFSYITDEHGGEPQINEGYSSTVESIVSEQAIAKYGSEENYSAQFNTMVDMIAENPETSDVTLMDYTYYFDTTDADCLTIMAQKSQKGHKGDKGNPGETGDSGRDGRVISSVTYDTLEGDIGTRATFIFSDGTSESFDIMGGQDGDLQPIDYNYITNSITQSIDPEQTIHTVQTNLYPDLQAYFDSIYAGAIGDVNAVRYGLANVREDFGGLYTSVDEIHGQVSTIAQYYRANQSALTTVSENLSAYSGIVSTQLSYIDALDSAVTTVGEIYDVMSGSVTSFAEEIQILDERTCAFTRDISEIKVETTGITRAVEHLSGEVRDLSVQVITATEAVTRISHQVCGVTTDMLLLEQSYDSISSKVQNLSGDIVTYSQIEQVATAITANVYSGLTRTGIDIEAGKIEFTTDNLVCMNKENEKTMWIDEDGNLGVTGSVFTGISNVTPSNLNRFFVDIKRGEQYDYSDNYMKTITTPYYRFITPKNSPTDFVVGGTYFLIPDMFKLSGTIRIEEGVFGNSKQILLPCIVPRTYIEGVGIISDTLRTYTTYKNGELHLLTEEELLRMDGKDYTIDFRLRGNLGMYVYIGEPLLSSGTTDDNQTYWELSGNTWGTIHLSTIPFVIVHFKKLRFRIEKLNTNGNSYNPPQYIYTDGIVPIFEDSLEGYTFWNFDDWHLFDPL